MKKTGKQLLAAALSVSMAATSCQISFAASTSNEVTQRETANAALAREAATQSMVLLENKDQVLPLKEGQKTLALFGGGAARTVRGGTGSGDPFNGGLSGGGDVNVNQSDRYHINIYKAFQDAGYEITTSELLDEYAKGYDEENEKVASSPMSTFAYPEMEFDDAQLEAAAAGTDTAVYVISRNAGEGTDRNMKNTITLTGDPNTQYEIGDYELSTVERQNLERVAAAFDKTIVVLNVGGIVDTKFFEEIPGLDALLLMGQCGQEGGNALLDVLTGAVTPSGKVISTWAENYEDYPASETFSNNDGDTDKEVYEEGIYVGYRYFDTFGIEPAYEFGYGKSYTDFEIRIQDAKADEDKVTVEAKVTNTGDTYSGKEVVQVYFSAPDTSCEKEYQELAAFGKTDELAPGESQILTISYNVNDMAYYDEAKAAYVLDAGTYYVRVGNSSRNTEIAAAITLDQPTITEQLSNQMEVPEAEELTEWSKAGKTPYTYANEQAEKESAPVFALDTDKIQTENNASSYEDETVTTYTTDEAYEPIQPYEQVQVVEDKSGSTLKDVADGKVTMEEFVAQMSLEELAKLNCGSGWGVANENAPIVGSNSSTVPGAAGETLAYEQYGIPSIVLADGPGGIRVKQEYEATNVETGEKDTYYQYCTAWPVGYVLAQSWDTDLVKRVGEAFGEELAEMDITLLLGPALNIHRDPLCGRNFEYFSEDPVVAGLMASAITRGVQTVPGVGACLKHYAANNQEANRERVDTIVSERALREIYLKGFEIAVKESQPMSIMTSYNKINGVPTADSYDLNTNIARGEWGFAGLIMTDWNGGSSTPSTSMHAGNDLIMPGGSSKANVIMRGATDYAPVFDENGQIGLTDELMYMFAYHSAAWGDFQVSSEGTETVDAKLGEGYVATTDSQGNILVNGEPIYREYTSQWWAGTGEYTTPVTTEVASVSEDGKTITYRGNYLDNNTITLGDVQKSAINNLNIIMKSNDMARIYGTEAVPYTEQFTDLISFQQVSRSEVTKESVKATGSYTMYVEGFDWGPGVTKIILSLDKTVDADSVSPEKFQAAVEKEGYFGNTSRGTRNITGAYTSDEEGNRVEGASSYITLEMSVHPDDGTSNPFFYNFMVGFNVWANPYTNTITLTDGSSLQAGDETITALDIDITAAGKIRPIAEEFVSSSFTSHDITLTYASYAPAEDGKKNPLIIWLHGAGEGGTDTDVTLLGNPVLNLAKSEIQDIFDGAYVLTPQAPTMWMDNGTGAYTQDGTSMYTETLMDLIRNYVDGNKDIDTNRIYLGGCSNGGFMTMNMILHYPEYFAAAYPICEAYTDAWISDEMLEQIKDLPIWFTHAANDPTVNPQTHTVATVERLREMGASNLHFSYFEDVHDTSGNYEGYQYNGHWSWLYTLNNQCEEDGVTIMEWMAEQTKEDITADLTIWINFMEGLDAEEYTAKSWSALQSAIDAAKAVKADKGATRAQIDRAVYDLVIAFGGLEYGVQKQHLQTAVDAAQAILDRAVNYEEESLAALKAVIEDAKVVLADRGATQDEVNQMAADVIDAIVQVVTDTDVASLEGLIAAVEEIDGSKYTPDSVAAVDAAAEAAREVLDNPNRGENDLFLAYKQLADAIRGLELKGNKAALISVIERARDILANSSKYTPSTIEGLGEVLEEAEAVYNDENANQAQVNAATEVLTRELAKVRLKGDVDGNGKIDTSDTWILLKHNAELAHLSDEQLEGADVNGDGLVDTKDVVLILQYASEEIEAF